MKRYAETQSQAITFTIIKLWPQKKELESRLNELNAEDPEKAQCEAEFKKVNDLLNKCLEYDQHFNESISKYENLISKDCQS